jgi:hypothetical protein
MKLARGDWGAQQLTDEAADTVAFVSLLIERGVIDTKRFDRRVAKKLKKMRRKYASNPR